ncbi:MAG: hypothetical protein DWQ34_24595 [Planctomycetota bacterium]|nr:MAG: hypothetical protein DWQ34_24595 [Planctomycetota bacterium]
MEYRYLTTSPEGLVQQLAVCYLRHGYWWYVTGRIPAGKDLLAVDQKLLDKYGIAISERERSRRKRAGLANMQYLRYDDWFILVATAGHHPFKPAERNQIRDCRRQPIRFAGYSISYRRSGVKNPGQPQKWHASVRIAPDVYKQLKAHFLERAMHRNVEALAREFASLPFARYAPVRRQLLHLRRAVNKSRVKMGFTELPVEALRLRRDPVRPFGGDVATGDSVR